MVTETQGQVQKKRAHFWPTQILHSGGAAHLSSLRHIFPRLLGTFPPGTSTRTGKMRRSNCMKVALVIGLVCCLVIALERITGELKPTFSQRIRPNAVVILTVDNFLLYDYITFEFHPEQMGKTLRR